MKIKKKEKKNENKQIKKRKTVGNIFAYIQNQ